MRNILKYIFTLCILFFIASCNKENGGITDSFKENEGCLALSMDITQLNTKSLTDDEILANSTLFIYDSEGMVIQKYSPASTTPDNIYLVAGSYRAELTTDSYSSLSFEESNLVFAGEKDFTIVAKQTNTLNLECKVLNTLVKVIFDQTTDRFDIKRECHISISDQFVEGSDAPTLIYTENNIGYFYMPEGIETLSWGFMGEASKADDTVLDGGALNVSYKGVIENIEPAMQYTMNFKYSKTPDGYLDFTVDIQETTDYNDDLIPFSLRPIIKGSGFNINEATNYVDGNISFEVSSILNQLDDIEITTNDMSITSFKPYENGLLNDLSANGVAYTPSADNKSGILTLSDAFFDQYNKFGGQTVIIKATDNEDSSGEIKTTINIEGLFDPQFDLWLNTAKLNACVTKPNASSVVIACRENGGEWENMTTIKDASGYYVASVEPVWIASKNPKNDNIYKLDGGFFAGKKYEYKLIIDGADSEIITFDATNKAHSIPNANMETSIPSWTESGSNGSSTWGSGNNSQSPSLCKQGTYAGSEGSKCSHLKAINAGMLGIYTLASGNLFYGQFSMSGTNGTVRFGQTFSWESRPKTFKFKYAAKLGTIDYDKFASEMRSDGLTPLSKGTTDKARIYMAIVDWSDRHGTTAGMSAPSGTWDPETQKSTAEGNIIGYASLWIEKSQEGSMVDVEIPIFYYDQTKKPSKTYSLVISAATSAYGDYMNGSTSTELWVDDFRFGY